MKRLIRRLTRVADSSQRQALLPETAPAAGKRTAAGSGGGSGGWRGRRRRSKVPEGHVPVCVGEEMERHVVRAELLGRPAFLELLRLSAQEYGYEQCGVLRIPVAVPLFRRLVVALSSGESEDADPALEEIFRSVPGEVRPSSEASL